MAEVLNVEFLKSLRSDVFHGRRLFLHEYMFQYLIFWSEASLDLDESRKAIILNLLQELKESGQIVCCRVNAPFEIRCNETRKTILVSLLPSGFDVGCVM